MNYWVLAFVGDWAHMNRDATQRTGLFYGTPSKPVRGIARKPPVKE
jgi:hypothetical protein